MSNEKEFKERSVLLLNFNLEVIDIINWKRAITLYFRDKVRVHEEFHDSYVSSPSFSMKLPSILIATDYKLSSKNKKKSVNLNKRNVLIRDDHTCSYCGKHLTEVTGSIDHITPLSRGGYNVWSNVILACRKCNQKKDDYTLEESGMKLLKQPFIPTKDIFLKRFIKNKEYESWRPYIKLKEK